MKIGRMLKAEGDYPKGALIAIHPGPGTAGALYVDEGRFDAWEAAGVLSVPKPKADPEAEETTPSAPARKKGGRP
jgi:hypothetical protein